MYFFCWALTPKNENKKNKTTSRLLTLIIQYYLKVKFNKTLGTNVYNNNYKRKFVIVTKLFSLIKYKLIIIYEKLYS